MFNFVGMIELVLIVTKAWLLNEDPSTVTLEFQGWPTCGFHAYGREGGF